MKTTSSILDKIAILLFFVLLTVASFCFAGNPVETSTKLNEKLKDSCSLASFTAKEVENSIYVNWFVKSNFDNYYFVLERSTDGKNYSVISIKKGFESPAAQILQFSYTDADISSSEEVYYRIKLQKVEDRDTDAHFCVLAAQDLFHSDQDASICLLTTHHSFAETTNNLLK